MSAYRALSWQRHGPWRWHTGGGLGFAADRRLVPITVGELPRAVGAFPLVFERGRDGELVAAALLGSRKGESVFVDGQGRWRGDYVPAYLRSHPFHLLRSASGSYVVAVDESSAALESEGEGGEPLFVDAEQPSPSLQRLIDFLKRYARHRVATERACAQIAECDVLEPLQAVAKRRGVALQAEGLYALSQEKLAALDAAALERLRDAGALPLVYGQLLSMGQLRTLERLAKARSREAQRLPGAEALFEEPDLEQRIDWDALDFDEPADPPQGE